MRRNLILAGGVLLALQACSEGDDAQTAASPLLSAAPTVLVDLDPDSAGTTYTVENLTANEDGELFFSDRESGNVLTLDPGSPQATIVGRLVDRTDAMGAVVKANGAGLVFTESGDLLVASGTFGEVLLLAESDLGNNPPVAAETFITGVAGANALLLDGATLFVSGGNTGNIYMAPVGGGAARVWATIEAGSRTVAPNDFMQSVVSNGMALDSGGALLVADTARGAIWRIPRAADGSAEAPEMMLQDPLLEGIDGITFDSEGRLWAAVNERNALVVIVDGRPVDAYKNDNAGPLEFPAALVFVGGVGYVANFDRPRADNLAADGMTSTAGVGSSIVRFSL